MESAASLMISANEKQDRNVMLCCETRRYQHANYAYTILLPVPLQEQQQKIPHLYCLNQLSVRQLMAEVHAHQNVIAGYSIYGKKISEPNFYNLSLKMFEVTLRTIPIHYPGALL